MFRRHTHSTNWRVIARTVGTVAAATGIGALTYASTQRLAAAVLAALTAVPTVSAFLDTKIHPHRPKQSRSTRNTRRAESQPRYDEGEAG